MASYAQEMRYRIVTPYPRGYARRQGQFVFRPLYSNDNNRYPIGNEMAVFTGYRMSQTPTEAEAGWIFRDYLDGTAFFRQNRFYHMVPRRNARQPVDELIADYYYVDTTLAGAGYMDEIIVLRRKPLSDYALTMANAEANLGDYLIQKYNIGRQPLGVEA